MRVYLKKQASQVAKSPDQGADNKQIKTAQAIFPDIFIQDTGAIKGAALDILGIVAMEITPVLAAAYLQFTVVFNNLAGSKEYPYYYDHRAGACKP